MLVEKLQQQSGLPKALLERYARTASDRYKEYTVPKRSGGQRLIAQPSKEIKAIQRWVMRALISRFPVHEASMAYAEGSSIRENALRHAGTNYTLRMDFREFFPSFKIQHVKSFLKIMSKNDDYGIDGKDILFIARIVCRHGALTIGAPSSPSLTNAMMFEFDVALSNMCTNFGFIYTRYADDIFISARDSAALGIMETKIASLVMKYKTANLSINDKKTVHLSRRRRRSITGLIITTERRVSIGLEKKQYVKSLIYKFKNGVLSDSEIDHLQGMISFIRDVEPPFYSTLVRKYGEDTALRLHQQARRNSKS